jgi:large subunit ribosomal protein L6
MSRIGKKPILLPEGVVVRVEGRRVQVEEKGKQLEWTVVPELQVELTGRTLQVLNPSPNLRSNSLWGTTRTVIDNMVIGVHTGFSKSLEVVGTGFRVALKGRTLAFQIGFDHEVTYVVPDDIEVAVTDRPMRINLKGIDRQRVGQIAAEIRGLKKPEPYQGKGIRYEKEVVRKKAGKAGA